MVRKAKPGQIIEVGGAARGSVEGCGALRTPRSITSSKAPWTTLETALSIAVEKDHGPEWQLSAQVQADTAEGQRIQRGPVSQGERKTAQFDCKATSQEKPNIRQFQDVIQLLEPPSG